MLQLESETKVRLRPAVIQLGLDLGEQNESRKIGFEMAQAMKGLDWLGAMEAILDAVKPVVGRYEEIASMAPPEYKELADYMVVHEQSLVDFTELELAGEYKSSIDSIVAQLTNKLPPP